MPISSLVASLDHKNASRMSASREGFLEREEKKTKEKKLQSPGHNSVGAIMISTWNQKAIREG